MEYKGFKLVMIKDGYYCGRGRGGIIPDYPENGWLGNPVKVGEICQFCNELHSTGGSTLKCYKKYLKHKLKTDPMFEEAFKFILRTNNRLSCFCKDKNNCHTKIMAGIYQAITY